MAKEDKKIGVITEIDGKSSNQISEEDRKKWAKELCRKLENLEGVTQAFIDDYHMSDFRIAAELEAKEMHDGFKILPELRVLGKNIKEVVDDDKYASANIVENTIEPPEKSEAYHNSKYYLISISYP